MLLCLMSITAELLAPEWILTDEGKPIKLMPGANHAAIQINLTVQFSKQSAFRIYSELDLRLDGRLLRPDLCLYPREPLNLTRETFRRTDPPLMLVEILSAGQGMEDVMEKKDYYLSVGVQSVWLVVPALRTVTVFTPNGHERIFASQGVVADPATGVTADLAVVFS